MLSKTMDFFNVMMIKKLGRRMGTLNRVFFHQEHGQMQQGSILFGAALVPHSQRSLAFLTEVLKIFSYEIYIIL
jgi:hypothetical protein